VEAIFENVDTRTAYWVDSDDDKKMQQFRNKNEANLAEDAHGHLVYLAPSMVNLQLAQDRHPDIRFHNTTETLKA
jgi:peptide chain release factor 3